MHWAGALCEQLAWPDQIRVLTVNVAWSSLLSFEPSCLWFLVTAASLLSALGNTDTYRTYLEKKRGAEDIITSCTRGPVRFYQRSRPHQSSFQEVPWVIFE